MSDTGKGSGGGGGGGGGGSEDHANDKGKDSPAAGLLRSDSSLVTPPRSSERRRRKSTLLLRQTLDRLGPGRHRRSAGGYSPPSGASTNATDISTAGPGTGDNYHGGGSGSRGYRSYSAGISITLNGERMNGSNQVIAEGVEAERIAAAVAATQASEAADGYDVTKPIAFSFGSAVGSARSDSHDGLTAHTEASEISPPPFEDNKDGSRPEAVNLDPPSSNITRRARSNTALGSNRTIPPAVRIRSLELEIARLQLTIEEREADVRVAAELGQHILQENTQLEAKSEALQAQIDERVLEVQQIKENASMWRQRCTEMSEANRQLIQDALKDTDPSHRRNQSSAEQWDSVSMEEFLKHELDRVVRVPVVSEVARGVGGGSSASSVPGTKDAVAVAPTGYTGDLSTDLHAFQRKLAMERRQWRHALSALEDNYRSLQQQKTETQLELRKFRDEDGDIETLRRENKQLRDQIVNLKDSIAEQEIEAMAETRAQVSEAKRALSDMVDRQDQQLQASERERRVLADENEALQERSVQLSQQLYAARVELDRFKRGNAAPSHMSAPSGVTSPLKDAMAHGGMGTDDVKNPAPVAAAAAAGAAGAAGAAAAAGNAAAAHPVRQGSLSQRSLMTPPFRLSHSDLSALENMFRRLHSQWQVSWNVLESNPFAKPVDWHPDEQYPACHVCARSFHFLRRRHHCRLCGRVFCHACSSRKIVLPDKLGVRKSARVCDPCLQIAVVCSRALEMEPEPDFEPQME